MVNGKCIIFTLDALVDLETETIFPGAINVLQALKENKILMGLVDVLPPETDAAPHFQLVDSCRLGPLFDRVWITCKMTPPQTYRYALRLMPGTPNKTAIVDTVLDRGIAWGNQHRLTTIWPVWHKKHSLMRNSSLVKPAHIITEFSDLLKIARSL